jgi:hypothetical protein
MALSAGLFPLYLANKGEIAGKLGFTNPRYFKEVRCGLIASVIQPGS